MGESIAGNRHAQRDAGDGPDQKTDQGAVKRHAGVEHEVAGDEVAPDPRQHRAQRRQHIGRERARARR